MIAAFELRGTTLLVVTTLLALVGQVTVMLLGMAWHRHDSRTRIPRQRPDLPDIWQTGGERLVARLDKDKKERDSDERDDNPP